MVRAYEKVEYVLKSHQPKALDNDAEKAIDEQVRSEFKELVK